MRFRKLRIAWSVVWGIAAVLLIVLWVRSSDYKYHIRISWPDPLRTHVILDRGWLNVRVIRFDMSKIDLNTTEFAHTPWLIRNDNHDRLLGWDYLVVRFPPSWYWVVGVPIWLPTLLIAIAGSVPWLTQVRASRFTLRTLLIATTLVALVLGLIVWLRVR